MSNEQKEGSKCIYCGGTLVSHFIPNGAGGQLDGLHCENCGLRFAFSVDPAKWQSLWESAPSGTSDLIGTGRLIPYADSKTASFPGQVNDAKETAGQPGR